MKISKNTLLNVAFSKYLPAFSAGLKLVLHSGRFQRTICTWNPRLESNIRQWLDGLEMIGCKLDMIGYHWMERTWRCVTALLDWTCLQKNSSLAGCLSITNSLKYRSCTVKDRRTTDTNTTTKRCCSQSLRRSERAPAFPVNYLIF